MRESHCLRLRESRSESEKKTTGVSLREGENVSVREGGIVRESPDVREREDDSLKESDSKRVGRRISEGESLSLVTQGTQTQAPSQTSTASVQTSPVRGHQRNHSIHSRTQAFGPTPTLAAQKHRRSLNLQSQLTTQSKTQPFRFKPLSRLSEAPQKGHISSQTQTFAHPPWAHPQPHTSQQTSVPTTRPSLSCRRGGQPSKPQPNLPDQSKTPAPPGPSPHQADPPPMHCQSQRTEGGCYRVDPSRRHQHPGPSSQGLNYGHRSKSSPHLQVNQPVTHQLTDKKPLPTNLTLNQPAPTRLTAYPRESPHPRPPQHPTINPRETKISAGYPRNPSSLTKPPQPSSYFKQHCQGTEETFSTLV